MLPFSIPEMSISIAYLTGLLALSLIVATLDRGNPFKADGQGVTWARCAGVAIGTYVLLHVPMIGALLALVGWFLAVIWLWDMSFGRAFVMLVANVALMFLMAYILDMIFGA